MVEGMKGSWFLYGLVAVILMGIVWWCFALVRCQKRLTYCSLSLSGVSAAVAAATCSVCGNVSVEGTIGCTKTCWLSPPVALTTAPAKTAIFVLVALLQQ